MTDEIQRARDEQEERDEKLGDNLALEPSPTFEGKSAGVCQKEGRFVCWNCFNLLSGKFTDLQMGHAIIRVCDDRACINKVLEQNAKRAGDGGAGSIITSGLGRRNDAGWPKE
jgi:hypothetical protein